jgi:hypothetical protein
LAKLEHWFAKTGANLNINGYSTSYTGLLNMVSESESGAAVLGKFSRRNLPDPAEIMVLQNLCKVPDINYEVPL